MILSGFVNPTVRLSNQLMESFKRIYDLKDIVHTQLLQTSTIPYRLRKVIKPYLYSLTNI